MMALHELVKNGNPITEIRQLVEAGADLTEEDTDGRNLLHIASANGNIEALKYFISLGVNINRKDYFGETPFLKTSDCHTNLTETIKILLDNEANVESADKIENNLIFLAVTKDRSIQDLKTILEFGIDWQVKNGYGEGILHMAAEHGHYEAIEYFISLGADVNLKDNLGETPLLSATRGKTNFSKTVEILKEKGADVQAMDQEENNLLFLAANAGRSIQDLEKIMRLGVEWKVKNKQRQTILHKSAEGGNAEAVKYFIGLGANVKLKDDNGNTPLHCACSSYISKEKFRELVTVLVENGANINAKAKHKRTVLTKMENQKIEEELIEFVKGLGGEH